MKATESGLQKRKTKVIDKRAAILNAALEQISEFGFHGTNIKMIAQSAQVAAGSIYNHFTNKEEVIRALYLKIGMDLNTLVLSVHHKDLPVEQNFLNIWKAILKFYISDPRKPEFITQYAYSPYIITQTKKHPDVLLQPVLAIFTTAKNEKKIKDLPNAALLALTHSPITSLVRMVKFERLTIHELDIEKYAQACWDAIKQ